MASFQEYDKLKSTDARFADFRAIQEQKDLYHYNGRIGATGGNERFRTGVSTPRFVVEGFNPDHIPMRIQIPIVFLQTDQVETRDCASHDNRFQKDQRRTIERLYQH